MSPQTISPARLLETISEVAKNYRHAPKQVAPGVPFEKDGVILKWSEVHPMGRPVPAEISQLARAFLATATLEASGPGIVVLHRCGEAFYFLIVSTWKNDNELWETVFYKDGDTMRDFALFPRDAAHKPTYCVWELMPIWHEKQAWVRFLESPRDEAAAERWLRDEYSGAA
ncbi:MAG TPA: hypothetical protein VIE39_09050 [Thermoanaerobaculia bacterium]|jgi:hypothetical protein